VIAQVQTIYASMRHRQNYSDRDDRATSVSGAGFVQPSRHRRRSITGLVSSVDANGMFQSGRRNRGSVRVITQLGHEGRPQSSGSSALATRQSITSVAFD
jgi:hypothetical protein